MNKIYKYPIHPDSLSVELPLNAEILSAGHQKSKGLVIWALVDTHRIEHTYDHRIQVCMTGETPDIGLKFLCTVQAEMTQFIDELVFHIYI